MSEVSIKVDIPELFKDRFEEVLTKAIKSFETELEFAVVENILSKSKLTEKQADELSEELKERVWERHKKEGW